MSQIQVDQTYTAGFQKKSLLLNYRDNTINAILCEGCFIFCVTIMNCNTNLATCIYSRVIGNTSN